MEEGFRKFSSSLMSSDERFVVFYAQLVVPAKASPFPCCAYSCCPAWRYVPHKPQLAAVTRCFYQFWVDSPSQSGVEGEGVYGPQLEK